jgi:5'-nucleotidase (lipoprotein e(P4) family)
MPFVSRVFVSCLVCSALLFAEGKQRNNENLHSTLWAQTSIEHDAAYLQAYRLARIQLDRALKDKKWTAALEQTGNYKKLPPAIILDIDETVLDNTPGQARLVNKDSDFNPALWDAWVGEAKAAALPGAVELTQYARSKGVTVFFITNRSLEQEPATRKNLEAAGFPLTAAKGPLTDTIICRAPGDGDKKGRREKVVNAYRVLLLFGDDLGDFMPDVDKTVEQRRALTAQYMNRFGVQWIVLPNAMYGSWERAVLNREPAKGREAKIELKFRSLSTGEATQK